MRNKILIIAPHPDDEVLGCGGTIFKKVKEGNEVFVAILTNASKTDPLKYTEDKLINVRNEAKKSCDYLGVKKIFFEDFPAPALDQYPGYKMAESISKILNETKADTLYIPFRGDIHNDHKAIFDASMVATRPVGNYSVKTIYAYETLSETEWAYPFAGETFIPTVFEKLDFSSFNAKLEAMKCYKSQLRIFPNSRSLEALEALAKFRGSTVGSERAEAFMLIRRIID
ncbi:MAG: PIG-L family deacetylase [Saprospiraceae bacterium]|nr:PIG-L family deacetylase [Saprospiraceae bacterium]